MRWWFWWEFCFCKWYCFWPLFEWRSNVFQSIESIFCIKTPLLDFHAFKAMPWIQSREDEMKTFGDARLARFERLYCYLFFYRPFPHLVICSPRFCDFSSFALSFKDHLFSRHSMILDNVIAQQNAKIFHLSYLEILLLQIEI